MSHPSAPDFELLDFNGKSVRLSDFKGKKNLVLVFLRGFMCPFCRAHLARLRDDYAAFTARDAEILVIGPDGPNAYRRYWSENNLPYIGLPDPKHKVADLYGQEWNLFKLGRVPALLIVDKSGLIRYQHYGNSMKDIPENALVLNELDKINRAMPASS